jgi:hypothetical protein
MKLEITFPGRSSVQGSLRKMAQSVQANALRQATARAASRGQTVAKREIAKEYNVKVGEAGRAFSISRNVKDPTTGLPAAVITASGKRGRNVILFLQGQRGRKRTRGPKPQLRFQIRRGRTVTIAGAFVAQHNRGTFVAQRVGRSRLPITAVSTIDVPGMFSARRIMEATKRQIIEVFMPEETTRGLRDAINRATKG